MSRVEIRPLVGHSADIIREAGQRQKRFWTMRPPLPTPKPIPQENWPKARPNRYYAADGNSVVIKGSELAEGVLPINVRPIHPSSAIKLKIKWRLLYNSPCHNKRRRKIHGNLV